MVFHRLAAAVGMAVFMCSGAARPAVAATALRVASDTGNPPGEFFTGNPKRLTGFDIDLMSAIGAKMHRTVTFVSRPFKTIISAVSNGDFDIGLSSITDTTAREKTVDFVDYLVVGTGMLVKAGNPLRLFSMSGLCGMNVPYQINFVQQTYVKEASQRCMRLHLNPINGLASNTLEEAAGKFIEGRAVTFIGDYPIVAYIARTQGGGRAYQVASRQFAVQPYGIIVSKRNPALRDDVQRALAAVIADGTYDALIRKWELEQAAMHSAPVNVAGLYE